MWHTIKVLSSGVYQIRNTITNDCYVGSSVNIHQRKTKHLYLLRTNKHDNPRLQNAVNKYGLENFSFEVLQHCKESDLLPLEQILINTIQPTYNIQQIAGLPPQAMNITRSVSVTDRITSVTYESMSEAARACGVRLYTIQWSIKSGTGRWVASGKKEERI